MKILVLSFYFEPDLCAGSFRTTALVNELCKHNDVNVEVISTLPNRYASFSAEAPKVEILKNKTIHRVSLPSHNSGMLDQARAFVSYYFQVMKIIRHQEYDAVYATSSRLFTAFLGARVSKTLKIPLYLDIRDIFVDTINDLLTSKITWLAKPIFSLIEKYSFTQAIKINLVSKGFKGYFSSRFPNQKFSWFTNGIDDVFLNSFTSIKHEANHPYKILYAGNIGEGQGLHEILPELSKKLLGKAEFTVIGDGGRKSLLESHLIESDNVTLLPPVKRNELIEAYKESDILFLHLNDYSAFEKVLPSKIFEYAAMGKPILAGVNGYAAEFLSQEVTNSAVFYPGDALGALTALESLSLETVDRGGFKEKFSRQIIMKSMSEDIIKVVQNAK